MRTQAGNKSPVLVPTVSQAHRELPWASDQTEWTVERVKRALIQHDNGDFSESSRLCDQMMRDGRIYSAMHSRTSGLIRLPFEMNPAENADGRRAKLVARESKEWFTGKIAPTSLREMHRWAVFMGMSLGSLAWERGSDGTKPIKLKVWHPKWLRYNVAFDAYYVSTRDDGQVYFTPGDGEWVLHSLGGEDRPWMTGAVRALAVPWLLRSFGLTDWSKWSEVHGGGVKKAKVPANAPPALVKRFLNQIANLGRFNTIKLPEGWDLDLMIADASATTDGFQRLLDYADKLITLIILGQTLTTDVGSTGGNRALGQVHREVELDIIEDDEEALSHTCRMQILTPATVYNYGDADLAPVPEWQTDVSPDPQTKAQTLLTLGQALAGLDALGVDIEPLLEEFGLETHAGVDLAARAEEALGTPDPSAQVVNPNEQIPPQAQDKSGPALTQQTPTDKPADVASEAINQTGGHADHASHLTTLAGIVKRGSIEGQGYIDKVVHSASAEAAQLLSADVDALLSAVEKGESFADIKKRLLAAYKRMDPAKLAELTGKAAIVGHLAGRAAVSQDARKKKSK